MKILIAVDWTENAQKAFDWYLGRLLQRDDILILAHFLGTGTDKEMHDKEAKMIELQELYETKLLQRMVQFRWLTGSSGSPGEFIMKSASDEHVDLIVMGPRNLGVVRKALLGSVSDYVVKKSTIPVLLYKRSS